MKPLTNERRKEIAGNFNIKLDTYLKGSGSGFTKKDVMMALGFSPCYCSMITNQLQWMKVPGKFWTWLDEFNDSFMNLTEYLEENGVTVKVTTGQPPSIKKSKAKTVPKEQGVHSPIEDNTGIPLGGMKPITEVLKEAVGSNLLSAVEINSMIDTLLKGDGYFKVKALIDQNLLSPENLKELFNYIAPSVFPGKAILKPGQIEDLYYKIQHFTAEEIDALVYSLNNPLERKHEEAEKERGQIERGVKVNLEINLVLKLNGKEIQA